MTMRGVSTLGMQFVFVFAIFALMAEAAEIGVPFLKDRRVADTRVRASISRHREITDMESDAVCPFKVCGEREIETEQGKMKVPEIVCQGVKDNCIQVYKKYNVIMKGKNMFNIGLKEKVKIPIGCVFLKVFSGSVLVQNKDKMNN